MDCRKAGIYVWVRAGGQGGRDREASGNMVVVAAFGAYGHGCYGGMGDSLMRWPRPDDRDM